MTDQHPTVTPPWDLKQQWREQAPRYRDGGIGSELWLIDRAAQWGYEQRGDVNEAKLQQARDQELEACCDWMSECTVGCPNELRAVRRPKPPSLKEQALKAAHIELDPQGKNGSLIIRALEALPDD